MNESKVSKSFLKVIGYAGYLLLVTFSAIFAMISLFAFVLSIIEKDILSVLACVAAGIIASIMWSVRKDTLV